MAIPFVVLIIPLLVVLLSWKSLLFGFTILKNTSSVSLNKFIYLYLFLFYQYALIHKWHPSFLFSPYVSSSLANIPTRLLDVSLVAEHLKLFLFFFTSSNSFLLNKLIRQLPLSLSLYYLKLSKYLMHP